MKGGVIHETGLVMLKKSWLNDNRLSWTAKGIFFYLASQPCDWMFSEDDLINNANNNVEEIEEALEELRKYGYIEETD